MRILDAHNRCASMRPRDGRGPSRAARRRGRRCNAIASSLDSFWNSWDVLERIRRQMVAKRARPHQRWRARDRALCAPLRVALNSAGFLHLPETKSNPHRSAAISRHQLAGITASIRGSRGLFWTLSVNAIAARIDRNCEPRPATPGDNSGAPLQCGFECAAPPARFAQISQQPAALRVSRLLCDGAVS